MTRHVLSGVTFKCRSPGLWSDPTGRWVIRRWDVYRQDPYWTLEDNGQVVETLSTFWHFQQSSVLVEFDPDALRVHANVQVGAEKTPGFVTALEGDRVTVQVGEDDAGRVTCVEVARSDVRVVR